MDLGAYLSRFSQAVRDKPNNLRKASECGERIIGYFCTYTPVEIIHACGFLPIRIWGGQVEVDRAYSLVPNFICPYMRFSMERALKGEFDFLTGIIQGYTCDVACGLMNIWKGHIGMQMYHSIALPYNDSAESREFFASALKETVIRLRDIGGTFSEQALHESLALYEQIRCRVLNLYEMRYAGALPFSAADLLTIVHAGFVMRPEEYSALLEGMENHLDTDTPPEPRGIPILISGSLLEDPALIEIIEGYGHRVVADDLCTGLRHFSPPSGSGTIPLDRLVDRYMNRFPCPSRVRAAQRVPLLMELIGRSGARGVVFAFQKFCTPHLADYPIVSQALRSRGIPSIVIEMEETGIMEGQLRTRLETFFSMLEA